MEKRNVPTVTIVGETFRMIAEYESEGLGLPGLPLVIVEYPMGGVPREEAVDRAQRAYDQVLTGLLVEGAGTGDGAGTGEAPQ